MPQTQQKRLILNKTTWLNKRSLRPVGNKVRRQSACIMDDHRRDDCKSLQRKAVLMLGLAKVGGAEFRAKSKPGHPDLAFRLYV